MSFYTNIGIICGKVSKWTKKVNFFKKKFGRIKKVRIFAARFERSRTFIENTGKDNEAIRCVSSGIERQKRSELQQN